jgi:hypothetical protein
MRLLRRCNTRRVQYHPRPCHWWRDSPQRSCMRSNKLSYGTMRPARAFAVCSCNYSLSLVIHSAYERVVRQPRPLSQLRRLRPLRQSAPYPTYRLNKDACALEGVGSVSLVAHDNRRESFVQYQNSGFLAGSSRPRGVLSGGAPAPPAAPLKHRRRACAAAVAASCLVGGVLHGCMYAPKSVGGVIGRGLLERKVVVSIAAAFPSQLGGVIAHRLSWLTTNVCLSQLVE